MDSIDYFDKRKDRSKEKKDLDVEWNALKKEKNSQKPKKQNKEINSDSTVKTDPKSQ